MSIKVWRVDGEYRKKKRRFVFTKELIADKEAHAREKILSELGSRHRVKRRDIVIQDLKELKHEEITSLELRKLLGLESEFE
jgi:large subunit ribosomal protein LX